MLQVTNDDKDDSKAVIEQEKEKKSDKPEEATKAEPKIVDIPNIKSEEQLQAEQAVRMQKNEEDKESRQGFFQSLGAMFSNAMQYIFGRNDKR